MQKNARKGCGSQGVAKRKRAEPKPTLDPRIIVKRYFLIRATRLVLAQLTGAELFGAIPIS
jgi:hypothetical protein